MESRNTFGTALCSCERNGLKCVTACGNCRKEGCNNAEEICLDEAESRDDIYEELEHFLYEV